MSGHLRGSSCGLSRRQSVGERKGGRGGCLVLIIVVCYSVAKALTSPENEGAKRRLEPQALLRRRKKKSPRFMPARCHGFVRTDKPEKSSSILERVSSQGGRKKKEKKKKGILPGTTPSCVSGPRCIRQRRLPTTKKKKKKKKKKKGVQAARCFSTTTDKRQKALTSLWKEREVPEGCNGDGDEKLDSGNLVRRKEEEREKREKEGDTTAMTSIVNAMQDAGKRWI